MAAGVLLAGPGAGVVAGFGAGALPLVGIEQVAVVQGAPLLVVDGCGVGVEVVGEQAERGEQLLAVGPAAQEVAGFQPVTLAEGGPGRGQAALGVARRLSRIPRR